ncbi:GntR family transcriptional regulator [Alkalicoccus daliensis]|uniref:GntR family transcriptional regulator n=1 Tax=Alkalicoccus daliensis TaxID=745820 RepID=A0A1H0ICE6_9BACI|nr:GntR family transcriptional regulator [Alkalicoccus daliensis]SDO29062.1 GntR family transcriptional regulator [Alkalicoccus daliensis]
MYFHIDPKSSIPLYEQIVNQVKDLTIRGLLHPGEKLPSVRELSSKMVINPNTVSKAYQELERMGLLVTVQGKGTFIADKTENTVTQREKDKLYKEMRKTTIDCIYAGLSKEEIITWINDCFSGKEGKEDGS